MRKVKVYVTLKENVLDPQGSAALHALHSLDYKSVSDVRIGKYMELVVDETQGNIDDVVKEMCEKILSNPVIEDYTYEIGEVVSE